MSMPEKTEELNEAGTDGEANQTGDQLFLLDDNLVEEILKRAPIKTLFKCKCVCKGWRNFINLNNSFIEMSKSLPPLTTGFIYHGQLREESKLTLFGFKNDIIDSNVVAHVNNNLSILKSSISPLASYNGFLLCCEMQSSHALYFNPNYFHYNPLTGQVAVLPKPHRQHFIRLTSLFCELNGKTIDFLVYSFVAQRFNEIEIEIYSSQTGKWKESLISHQHGSFSPGASVMFDGRTYSVFVSKRLLFVYDLKEENTHFIELPLLCRHSLYYHVKVAADGLIYYIEGSQTNCYFWVLSDGAEWLLAHSVGLESLLEFPFTSQFRYIFMPVAFHPLDPGVVLATFSFSNTHVLYDLNTGRIEPAHNFLPRKSNQQLRIIPYSLPSWLPFLYEFKATASSSGVQSLLTFIPLAHFASL